MMINLQEILEIIDEVRLNNDCGLVNNILLLTPDGIEFGYSVDGYGYEVTKRFTYRELFSMYSLYNNLYSTCEGMLIVLKQKALDNERLHLTGVETFSGTGPIIF